MQLPPRKFGSTPAPPPAITPQASPLGSPPLDTPLQQLLVSSFTQHFPQALHVALAHAGWPVCPQIMPTVHAEQSASVLQVVVEEV